MQNKPKNLEMSVELKRRGAFGLDSLAGRRAIRAAQRKDSNLGPLRFFLVLADGNLTKGLHVDLVARQNGLTCL